MTTHQKLSRRAAVRALSLGIAAGKELLVAAPPARCTVADASGEPLKAEAFSRFHACDKRLQPIAIEPQFEAGMATFDPPGNPFRLSLPLTVPGFGQVFVYADNRGRGYTAESFAKPLFLNHEFAADRLATVHGLVERSRQSGITVSKVTLARVEKAQALLGKAEDLIQDRTAYARMLMSSLSESLWAGEMLVVERAEQTIARQGMRPGFLFGCNAFQYPNFGQKYAAQFEGLFNFATLPFYRGFLERVEGKPDYSAPENLLPWLGRANIITKGHPLIFLSDVTPKWLRNLPFERTKELCLSHVREAILRFRSRIHVWDVINEAHVQPEAGTGMEGFTQEQNVELTGAALKVARDADPTCFRIVNSTGTWSDYYMGRKPARWQQSVYDYLQMVKDARIGYEAAGLQYYHSGRDLLEFERNIDGFAGCGKPIHITELGIPSSSEEVGENEWWGGGVNGSRMPWHGERHSEATQADWVEQLYKIAFSKPFVEAITWWDMRDPAFVPHGGLIHSNGAPKPAYERLSALLGKWRADGVLPVSQGSA